MGSSQFQAQTEWHQEDGTPEVFTAVPATASPEDDSNARAACREMEGRTERVEYSSQLLGEYIPVIVYLPPCYSDQKEYPVLYLLHGKPQDENHWLILGVDEVVNRRISAGRLSDLILVMPEQPEPLFSLTDGGPGSYEGEFLSTLLPFIEANYAASNQPDLRALAGISRGGVWALEIGFSNPEMFAGVAGLSPALNVNDARQEYDPLAIAESVSDFS